MFRNWGFLVGEIWVLLALAALVGLIAGRTIWRRRSVHKENAKIQVELDKCRAELEQCRQENANTPSKNTRPSALDAPRDGVADDLTQIKGIGAKMEKLCNALGFYHFDQIANWTSTEVAWVDENLEGFKGRVTRDNWVKQAQKLAGDEAT